MPFLVVPSQSDVMRAVTPGVYLVHSSWNDWWKYETLYSLFLVVTPGAVVHTGSVKIGQQGMTPTVKVPPIGESFDALDQTFFSVGQSEDYYQTINQYPAFREEIYLGLRDCAYNLEIFDENLGEDVMGESLLRGVSSASVRGRLHRLSHGRAELTNYSFTYLLPDARDNSYTRLAFDVAPRSMPPTNVHALIGRNGVGKTRCLSGMIDAILGRPAPEGETAGAFEIDNEHENGTFRNLVTVSFSAFDSSDPLPFNTVGNQVQYFYIGLKHQPPARHDGPRGENLAPRAPWASALKDVPQLADEFIRSMEQCQVDLRKVRWSRALTTLQSDPLFEESEVATFSTMTLDEEGKAAVRRRFRRLSSGHAIVLLTITRLIELVDERSLVLIDEPEVHLHPPLLSAFVRALSDLLISRNGVAIVATHSPVVLQEVPRNSVWILNRSRLHTRSDRPEIETFGENVSILTRHVFGLEVRRSGFHALIEAAVNRYRGDYEQVLRHFNGQMGAEGRAIAMGMCATWASEDEAGDVESE
ncbi:MAG TPA: AAA family ATPase [Acidobacteriaceae bacterium]|jgi:ABC-type multidrug transport system ATPase subunit|nr:AAA family ATPase [Acidobacteriaceae bacterium]